MPQSQVYARRMFRTPCVICAKHRGEGPLRGELVASVDGIRIYHRVDDDGSAPLGYLFIETERHAPYVSDLTPDEARAVGWIRTEVARALREAVSAEYVFAMVIGTGADHFHEHVFARHPGAEADLPWHDSHQQAPRGTPEAVARLCRLLERSVTAARQRAAMRPGMPRSPNRR